MSKPVEIEFLIRDRMSGGVDKIGLKVDELTGKAVSADAEVNAINDRMLELRNVIALLEGQLEKLETAGRVASEGLDQSENITKVEAVKEKIEELESELKQLEKTSAGVTVTPADIPQATQKFNGLNMSIQQIAREMPSLAMGPQMFFLAISNNLPIFADEVKRARTEYQALVAAGQKGTPVWKQILSSLFSWQTALTTGIMLLVMYGDEIVNWVGDLFSAKKGVDEFNISLEEMAEIEKSGRAEMIRTRFELSNLADELKNYSGTKEEEKQKVDELNRKYGEAFGYYETVAEWYDIITKKSEDYIQMLFLQAKAQSLVNKAIEADEKLTEVKNTEADDVEGSMNWFQKASMYLAQGEMAQVGQTFDADKIIKEHNEQAKKDAIAAAQAAVDGYLEEAKKITEQVAEIGKGADIGGHVSPKVKTTSARSNASSIKREEAAAERRKQIEVRLGQELADLQRENDAEDIELMDEGLQKKLRQIDNDYQARKNEIAKQESEWKQDNKKAGLTDVDENGLTAAQSAALTEAGELNERTRQKALEEIQEEELASMREYLKVYGTYKQQREAIDEEYSKKISEASTEGEKLSLQKEMEAALSEVDMKQLKEELNWDGLFGNLSAMTKQELERVKQLLKQFRNSDEYKGLSISDKKEFETAFDKVEQAISADSGLFGGLVSAMREYDTALQELETAQKEYDAALATGIDEVISEAKKKLTNAQNNVTTKRQTKETVEDATLNKVTKLSGVIAQLGDASELTLSDIGQLTETATSAFSEAAGKVGGIIGAILAILDSIGDQDIDEWVDGIATKVFTALGSAFDSKYSLLHYIAGDLLGSSDKTLEKDIETLTESNESLANAIERLSDKMDEATLLESGGIYEQQVADIEQSMRNTQEMMSRSGAAYSNGFLGIGGSHSSNHKINNAITASEWAQVSEIVGRTINSASDFWSLSSEEMWKVADEAYSVYSKIQQYADDGYKNAAEYMDTYIEYYEQLQELQDAYREKLTSYSFDDIESEFKSQLLDMETDAEDFADSFEDMMKQAVVNSMMSNTYSKKLKEWYEAFADSLESDGELTAAEQEALRSQYEAIVNSALEERNALIDAMGWDISSSTSQSAKSGSFDTMTQDQGTKLEGMFTSGLQHWSSMDSRLENVSEKMDTAEGHLARIAENTGASAGHLSEIKEDIKKMIRDGLKVK